MKKYVPDRSVPIWNEYLQHDTYDDYWKKRNIRQYLKNIKISILVVGGWFDAEDLYGALHTYQALENGEAANQSILVMDPQPIEPGPAGNGNNLLHMILAATQANFSRFD